MVFDTRRGMVIIAYVFLQLTGTIFATDENANRRQYVYNATENYNPAVACTDHPQRTDVCALAGKPCHCEENRYEMYTYCKRSCGYCAQERLPQRFWRVVNWAPLNRTWFVSEIQFFKSKHDKTPLPTNNPGSAIASSTYLSFPASHAFDGNRDTAWLPDGWWERIAGGDWIGYDFPSPVDINSVRVISDYNDTSDVAGKILVEAGPTAFGPFQTRWMSVNSERNADVRFNNPRCPLFWKRLMSDKDAFCYKLVTEYLTWAEARDKCGSYGGDLASINTHEEQVFVQQELLACGYTWLGMNDRDKEGEFVWSDGKNSSFFYWANEWDTDERMNEMEDCVAMQKTGEWRTFHCDNRFYFFCKKRILTDNDKIIEPNTAHRPTQPINQTLPAGVPPPETPLPPEIEYPPGITPPPPPPYPYPYPTPPPPRGPHTPGPVTHPAGGPAPGSQPPNTGGPAPATPPANPQAPPPAGGAAPPPAGGAAPPPAAATPPAAPVAPAAAAPPPVVAPAPVAAPQPVVAPAPVAAPPPVVAPAPATAPKHHKHQSKKLKKKKHKKAFHGTIKRKAKKKIVKKHSKKKTEKIDKEKEKQADKHEDDDFDMDDDFLDMVTRSNIPQPKLSTEKQLRSGQEEMRQKS